MRVRFNALSSLFALDSRQFYVSYMSSLQYLYAVTTSLEEDENDK